MGCCSDPQFVPVSICDTFTTTGGDVVGGAVVFNNTGGPILSGYVTLTNSPTSGIITASLANNGTNIIGPLASGESQTVYVSNIGTLVAFSGTAGQPVSGRVCVDAARQVA
ncbi:S-Ena type endospore appendage [Bacillus mycoides]|uniref:S-Ena type endospore appendage n=1 Tax=Bacillus mycoides TaxID=1405 RepID=UPI001C5DD557|nr:S-Ena type endospore appendage [Bacillus mycoides]